MKNRVKGFTLIELLIVVAIILVIAAIAIPNLRQQRMTANEAAAIANLHRLNDAMVTYQVRFSTFPKNGLADLQPPVQGGNPDATHADIMDQTMARDPASRTGYVYTYTAGAPDSFGSVSSYKISAVPVSMNTSGQKTFFTDESGIVRASMSGVADANSPPA